ncbi:MAG: ribosome silencing factor [Clostridia bacterium]|nr:MAG: ribosome silencing factor [Clostridia bacterium]
MDVVVLDLHGISLVADYFIIASATSTVHAQAVADGILMELKARGYQAVRREGYQHARWILLDYGEVVVHIFQPGERLFYDLEHLWGDAAVVEM